MTQLTLTEVGGASAPALPSYTYVVMFKDDSPLEVTGRITSADNDPRLVIEDEDGDLHVFNWDFVFGYTEVAID